MTELTQEEIRDTVLTILDNNDETLQSIISKVEKIEEEAIITFERKVIALKNKLISDTTINDEDLERLYLEHIEETRHLIFKETENKIKELIEKQSAETV